MNLLRITIGLFVAVLFFTVNGYSRTVNPICDSYGRIYGEFHTSCFPWSASEGDTNISGTSNHNDTARLKYLLEGSSTIGKVIFDEPAYYINDSIILYSYRTVIGTGRASTTEAGYLSSRIIQTANDKPIFTIGGGISDVAVRDIALVAGSGTSGTIGILAQNGTTAATSLLSINFEFTNLTFTGLNKGIYVNAQPYGTCNATDASGCEGFWRFDNVKLDHADFQSCNIGVHVNSNNSGWSMKNLSLVIPAGNNLPTSNGAPTPISSATVGTLGLTFGVYLERVAYSTLDLLISDGYGGTGFVYVGQHANLNIQSSIDESLKNSYFIYGGNADSPITLTNNTIQAPLTVRGSTVVSTGNQFSLNSTSPAVPDFAKAIQGSRIYSLGDKFCRQVGSTACTDDREEGYQADSTSEILFTPNRLRIGPQYYAYKVTRSPITGILEFAAEQGTGIGGGNTTPGYAGYSFKTAGGTVQVNYDGSVSFGTKTYSQLIANTNLVGSAPPPDGTVVYCSDCLKTTPCSAGTSSNGAMAKRLHGTWDCD